MKTPRLQINLENGAINIVKAARENEEPYLILDIELDELKALPPSEAAYRIGGTILNLLRVWHPSEFGEWSVPSVFDGVRKDAKD
jgi:hypothetical protein